MRSTSETEDRQQRQVDAVLRGLCAAEPGEGFETRLADNLSRRATACEVGERPEAPWLPVFSRPRGLVLGVAVACSLLMVVGVWIGDWHRGAPAHAIDRVSRAQMQRPAQVLGANDSLTSAAPVVTARLAITAGTRLESPRLRQVPRDTLTNRPGVIARQLADDVAQSAVLDEAAQEDFHMPSFPAPAMPPTAQERRVRLMLRRGEKHNLAQLDPARGVLSAGQDKAALRSFFDPPRPESDPFQGVLPQ